ncbi:MAG: HepT-like ribonuclease domain-containing protein [Candidatus Dormibacteraceae bacterium]
MPQPDDRARLLHLIEGAEKAIAFAANRSRKDLDEDETLRLVLTKLVEIVGEAAKQVSDSTQTAHPEIPWKRMARTRDRLVHHYFDINLDILWDTVNDDLPMLLKAVKQIRIDQV